MPKRSFGELFTVLKDHCRLAAAGGVGRTSKNIALRLLNRRLYLHSPRARYPLLARHGTSDVDAFRQIFVGNEYGAIPDDFLASTIVDCGANVGYSAAYFASKYPDARIIAVEPDPANFKVLRDNTAPFGRRISTICSGVWSRHVGLKVVRGKFRDGREWSTQVREVVPGETPDVMAVGIDDLLSRYGIEEIDILKIDIERAEVELFSNNYLSWLPRVRTIIIELHDDTCRDVFVRALKMTGNPYDISSSGEPTLATRLAR